MERAEFELLVARAVESLPKEFQEQLENVDVVVEDQPSRAQQASLKLRRDESLLGLYEGVPQTEREHYGLVLPDKITIFQKAIEERCSGKSAIVREIQKVVQHEIAHHFGIGDERLMEIERDKGKGARRQQND
jgi:predicted Zn-dependent protease with MMP-like domain